MSDLSAVPSSSTIALDLPPFSPVECLHPSELPTHFAQKTISESSSSRDFFLSEHHNHGDLCGTDPFSSALPLLELPLFSPLPPLPAQESMAPLSSQAVLNDGAEHHSSASDTSFATLLEQLSAPPSNYPHNRSTDDPLLLGETPVSLSKADQTEDNATFHRMMDFLGDGDRWDSPDTGGGELPMPATTVGFGGTTVFDPCFASLSPSPPVKTTPLSSSSRPREKSLSAQPTRPSLPSTRASSSSKPHQRHHPSASSSTSGLPPPFTPPSKRALASSLWAAKPEDWTDALMPSFLFPTSPSAHLTWAPPVGLLCLPTIARQMVRGNMPPTALRNSGRVLRVWDLATQVSEVGWSMATQDADPNVDDWLKLVARWEERAQALVTRPEDDQLWNSLLRQKQAVANPSAVVGAPPTVDAPAAAAAAAAAAPTSDDRPNIYIDWPATWLSAYLLYRRCLEERDGRADAHGESFWRPRLRILWQHCETMSSAPQDTPLHQICLIRLWVGQHLVHLTEVCRDYRHVLELLTTMEALFPLMLEHAQRAMASDAPNMMNLWLTTAQAMTRWIVEHRLFAYFHLAEWAAALQVAELGVRLCLAPPSTGVVFASPTVRLGAAAIVAQHSQAAKNKGVSLLQCRRSSATGTFSEGDLPPTENQRLLLLFRRAQVLLRAALGQHTDAWGLFLQVQRAMPAYHTSHQLDQAMLNFMDGLYARAAELMQTSFPGLPITLHMTMLCAELRDTKGERHTLFHPYTAAHGERRVMHTLVDGSRRSVTARHLQFLCMQRIEDDSRAWIRRQFLDWITRDLKLARVSCHQAQRLSRGEHSPLTNHLLRMAPYVLYFPHTTPPM